MEMPAEVTWVRNNVLRCSRCNTECNVSDPSVGQEGWARFLQRHGPKACTPDIGARLASSMTIRESFAAQMLAALTHRYDGSIPQPELRAERALKLADALIEVLKRSAVEKVPEGLSLEEFERVANDAPRPS